MSNLFELDEFLKHQSPLYDVFITTKGVQQRTNRGKNLLNEYGIKIGFTLNIKFVPSRKPRTATILGTSSDETIYCDFEEVEKGVNKIIECCKQKSNFGNNSKILIDITGFIAPYLFYLFKQLVVVEKIKNVDTIYTAPLTYRKYSEGFKFSEGIKQIREIRNYYGTSNASYSNLLISIIGFEGFRSLEVLRSLDPHKTIAINGFPPYSLEFKDTSILENKDLINDSSCRNSVMMAAAHDPFHTIRVLEYIHAKNKKSFNIAISPLGTKPMSLGACIFCLRHDNIRVVYPYPTEYVEENTAQKYGKTWIYKTSQLM